MSHPLHIWNRITLWDVKGLSAEAIHFPSIKQEFLDFIDPFLVVIESSIIDSLNKRQISLKLNAFDRLYFKSTNIIICDIQEFVNKYGHVFNGDVFRNIFDRNSSFHYMQSGSVNAEVERLIEVIANEYRKSLMTYGWSNKELYEDERAENECKWKLQNLAGEDKNIPWYIVLKLFRKRLEETEDIHSFFYYIASIQNSVLFKWTDFEKNLNEFLSKYALSLLSTNQVCKLLDTEKWEEIVQKIISSPIKKEVQFDFCLFIMEYHSKKYTKYLPQIFEICIEWLKNKLQVPWVISSKPEPISLNNIKMLYEYYSENRKTINPHLDVEWAFESYWDLYCVEDFEHQDNLSAWLMPLSYVKKWFRWTISTLLKSIKNEEKENSSSQIHDMLGRMRIPGLFEYHLRDLNIDPYFEWMNPELFKEYHELRKSKPKKHSEQAVNLKALRSELKSTNDISAVRQRIFSYIISCIYPNISPQQWPSIWEELQKRKYNAHKIATEKRDKLLEARLAWWWRERKLWKPYPPINQDENNIDIPF